MKKTEINYLKGWDVGGYVYKQTIKLDRAYIPELQKAINQDIKNAWENCNTYTRDHLRPLDNEQLEGKAVIALTQLRAIYSVLKNDRILFDRNTRLLFY